MNKMLQKAEGNTLKLLQHFGNGGSMELLRTLQEARTPFGEAFFQLVTYLGQEVVVMAVLGILYWCIHKEFAYRLGFGFFLSGLLVQTMKITFRIPRPWVRDVSLQPVKSAVSAATGYSFPSGHTQAATVLYGTFLWKAKKWWLRAILAAVIALVGFSRMYLGVHTPADVLVSMCTAIILIGIVNIAYDKGFFEKHKLLIAFGVSGLSFAVMIYARVLNAKGIVPYEQAADCMKAAAAGIAFGIGWYLETTYVNFSTKTAKLWHQAVKLLVGLIGALVIKSGLKVLLGETLLIDSIRYFLLVLWVTVLYPLLLVRFWGRQ